MQKSASPTQFVLPFAGDAGSQYRNTIPIPSQQGTTPGAASFTDGFPPVTMEPIASGGVPPYGADMNGILYALNLALQWQQAGFLYPYSSAFATNAGVNGYPAGALLAASGLNCLWFNKADNNQTNPDSSASAGWLNVLPNAGQVAVSTTGGTTTLTPSQLVGPLITVTGTLTSNATLVLPLVAGSSYIVQNSTTGAYTLTVQSATGAGVVVAQGAGAPRAVLCDGTNWYSEGLSGGPYLPLDGTAQAAVKLAAARAFSITGLATAAGVNFDGTGAVALNVTALNVPGALGYTPANDSAVVHITGTENITGTKTFAALANFSSGIHVTGYALATQGSYISWNVTGNGYNGDMDFVNHHGGGTGGWNFFDTAGSTLSLAASIGPTGSARFNGPLFVSTNGTAANVNGITGLGVTANMSGGSAEVDFIANWPSVPPSGFNFYVSESGAAPTLIASIFNGSASVNGSFTCATMNATSSDRRLKCDIHKFTPRPLHRSARFVGYTLKSNGWHGLGSIAQEVQAIAPEHVGEFEQDGKQYLSLNYAGMAYEQAIWAGQEIDRLAKRIEKLEASRLPCKPGWLRRVREVLW